MPPTEREKQMSLERYYAAILRRSSGVAPTLSEAAQDYRHVQDLHRAVLEFGGI
jgi:hypothetical protein